MLEFSPMLPTFLIRFSGFPLTVSALAPRDTRVLSPIISPINQLHYETSPSPRFSIEQLYNLPSRLESKQSFQ